MNPPSEETLFAEALARPPAERAAYLDQACGGDASLRARLDALLAAAASARNFMETSAVAHVGNRIRGAVRAGLPATAMAAEEEKPGDHIGRYKLLQKLGEGGCGVVYVAEQEEPVRRRVALKVIKLGMDTHEIIARFEAERQALALMDHPNIAKVFDAGATDRGRPFFVMELVRGIPLTDYCDDHSASTAERLELFILICHAVQHAHQKGIIHRDLKPSNILVTINDGVAVPKIIDFGIAKATQGRLTDKTVYTAFEQFIGTPAYMSPEQAVMTSLDIDTRSDIYSLGVLLYELLTGRTPFDAKEMLAAGLDEMRRRIREVEPPRPSTRLSTMEGDALTSTARLRHTEAPKLLSLIRGDLDWIVMRCLEKDRTRRYETANGLADDIRRHLTNEPVSATPPSTVYRFQKLVRRNKLVFAAAAAIAAALLIGAAVATWQAVRATRAEHRARAERDAANRARQAEATARALAEQRRTEVETINKLLLSDTLTSADPEFSRGRDITVREVLDNAALRIPKAFADNPLLEAAIRTTMGETYSKLSLFDKADPHLQAAVDTRRRLLGEEHPDTLTALRSFGALRVLQMRKDEGEKILTEVLALQERTHGPDHEETLKTINEIFYVKDLRTQSPMPRAERQPLVAEAERFARLGFERAKQRLGPEHPLTLLHMQNVESALSRAGKRDEALPLARQMLEIRRRVSGPDHPETIFAMLELGIALPDSEEREKTRRECLALAERVLGPDHVYTLMLSRHLGWQLLSTKRAPEAGDFYLRSAATAPRVFGFENPRSGVFTMEMGLMVVDMGRPEDAARFALERLPDARRLLPAGAHYIGALQNVIGRARLAQQRPAEAETALRESLAILEKTTPGQFSTQSLLGAALLAQRKFAEAEPLLLAGYEGMQKNSERTLARTKYQIWDGLERLVRLYQAWEQPAKAAEWKKQLDDWGPPPARLPKVNQTIPASTLQVLAPVNLEFAELAPGESPAPVTTAAPSGWRKFGNQMENFIVGLDRAHPHRQPVSAYVKTAAPELRGMSGLSQAFSAEKYRNQRLRFTAWVKTENVAENARLWMRIDRANGSSLVNDSMGDRLIKGTTEWTQHAVVLDVPAEAARVTIGFYIVGTGQMWANDARFEPVGPDVPVTAPTAKPAPSPGN